MVANNRNNRQTGARKFEAHPEEVDRDRVGIGAAENRRSGLMREVDETMEGTLESDALDQRPPPEQRPRRTEGPARKRS